jgi:hypothetical protein
MIAAMKILLVLAILLTVSDAFACDLSLVAPATTPRAVWWYSRAASPGAAA